jgi:heat shock protein HspQ
MDVGASTVGERSLTAGQSRAKTLIGFELANGIYVITRQAKFRIGQIVRHRIYPFRGIIFDVDPEFNEQESWLEAIPEAIRPRRDQPFYHLLAENSEEEEEYQAYVSEQNLETDVSGEPLVHTQVPDIFFKDTDGEYRVKASNKH